MIVKIELIILSIIAIVSFITGVVINILDSLREKKLRENKLKARIMNAPLDGTTIINVNNTNINRNDKPVIVKSMDTDDDII
ncbi:MAG: hypothetical protein IJI43_03295 [Bacilli bacterium]|nr:hypothetical protein [Bacilli bacterium]